MNLLFQALNVEEYGLDLFVSFVILLEYLVPYVVRVKCVYIYIEPVLFPSAEHLTELPFELGYPLKSLATNFDRLVGRGTDKDWLIRILKIPSQDNA